MADNKKTFYIQGKADFSNIISQINDLKKNLTNSQKSGETFLKLEKDQKALERLSIELESLLKKGFSNQNDVQQFLKTLEKAELTAENIDTAFQKIGTENVREVYKELENSRKTMTKIEEQLNKTMQGFEKESDIVKDFVKKYKEVSTAEKTTTEIAKDRLKVQKDALDNINEQISAQEKLIQTTKLGLEAKKQQTLVNLSTNATLDNGNSLTLRGQKINNSGVDINNFINNSGKNDRVIFSEIEKKFKEIVISSSSATNAIKLFKEALKDMNVGIAKGSGKGFESIFKDLINNDTSIQKARAAYQSIGGDIENLEKYLAMLNTQKAKIADPAIVEIINKITDELRKQGVVVKQNEDAHKKAVNAFSGNASNSVVNALKGQTTALKEQASAATETIARNKELDSTFDRLQTSVKSLFSVFNVYRQIRKTITDTFNTIKELDKSFASIAMVTKYSVQGMWAQYDSYAAMAKKLGQSTKDVISASALFYQQGI